MWGQFSPLFLFVGVSLALVGILGGWMGGVVLCLKLKHVFKKLLQNKNKPHEPQGQIYLLNRHER